MQTCAAGHSFRRDQVGLCPSRREGADARLARREKGDREVFLRGPIRGVALGARGETGKVFLRADRPQA